MKSGFNEKRMDVNFVEMGILVYGVILFQMWNLKKKKKGMKRMRILSRCFKGEV